MQYSILQCRITFSNLYKHQWFCLPLLWKSFFATLLKLSCPSTTTIGQRACRVSSSLDLRKLRKWRRCEREGLVQRLLGYTDSLHTFCENKSCRPSFFEIQSCLLAWNRRQAHALSKRGNFRHQPFSPCPEGCWWKRGISWHFPFAKIFGAVAIWPLWTVSSFIMAFRTFQFDMDLAWFVTKPMTPMLFDLFNLEIK